MDHELALAVVGRYQSGLPVAETTFFKAAQALGADPHDALLEARFHTMLGYDLKKVASGHRLSPASVALYSAAAGELPATLTKTASRYHLDPLELAFRKLAEADWVPNLPFLKAAMMADPGMAAPGMDQMMDPAAQGGMPPQDPAAAQPPPPGPMPGAMVQAPRYKPSPMAPMQAPPSSEGNLQELVDAARHPDAGGDAQVAMQQPGGSMGPEAGPGSMDPAMGPDAGQQAPPPMSPDQKLQQVDPSIDPQTMERWAPKLQQIEEQTGIQMNDPGQIQKFISEMQKADQKTLDEAIKAMNQPQPLNKPTNPNSPAAQQPAEGGEEKVAGKLRRVYLP